MAAISGGHVDTVFTLLEEKADPSRRNRLNGTPLEKAADLGYTHQEIVKDLLEYGAETDLSVKGQAMHILHRAARFNMQELATYCLDKSCDVNMITTEGPAYHKKYGDFPHEMTPLAYACAEGKELMKPSPGYEKSESPLTCYGPWLTLRINQVMSEWWTC